VAYASFRLLKPECAGAQVVTAWHCMAWRGMLERGVVHMHRIRNQGKGPVSIQLLRRVPLTAMMLHDLPLQRSPIKTTA